MRSALVTALVAVLDAAFFVSLLLVESVSLVADCSFQGGARLGRIPLGPGLELHSPQIFFRYFLYPAFSRSSNSFSETWLTLLRQSLKQSPFKCHLVYILILSFPFQMGRLSIHFPQKVSFQDSPCWILNSST